MASLELLIKPLKFMDAIKRLGKKKPIAKKLSSKQWAAMPTHIRERAYFTANVESMKFLNRSKKMLNDYLSGARETVITPDGRRVTALKKASRADFVYEMQKLAKETGLGNVLPPGKDMSRDLRTRMKDIASESRLNLIFDTQTQQAQAYGYYKQGQDPAILDAYPAQRFIRAEQRKVPRPLHKSNRNEVRRKDDMEFWLRMNDQSIGGLGVPFGPWGFNSGMDVEDVRRDKAIQMGLIAKNEQVLPPDDTFNKGLKAAADVEPEFLKKFMNKMGDEAINYGETVELSQRMSDVPQPAPAKRISISEPKGVQSFENDAGEFKNQQNFVAQVNDEGLELAARGGLTGSRFTKWKEFSGKENRETLSKWGREDKENFVKRIVGEREYNEYERILKSDRLKLQQDTLVHFGMDSEGAAAHSWRKGSQITFYGARHTGISQKRALRYAVPKTTTKDKPAVLVNLTGKKGQKAIAAEAFDSPEMVFMPGMSIKIKKSKLNLVLTEAGKKWVRVIDADVIGDGTKFLKTTMELGESAAKGL